MTTLPVSPVPSAPQLIAEALGIAPSGDGCSCAFCGVSRFEAAGPVSLVVGDKFSAQASLPDPSADVCRGCARLLAGRPGDDPPPLRTFSFLVVGGTLHPLRTMDFWRILTDPPDQPFVASWAVSRQVHHWMNARVSTRHQIRIGSDSCTIEFSPSRDMPLAIAVRALLYSPTGTGPLLSRSTILTGSFHPSAASKFGIAELRRLDAVVEPRRGDPLLNLLVACAPTHSDHSEIQSMIEPSEQQAASLLACIAAASSLRKRDGKTFWGGFFRHRVERFKDLELPNFISRMLDDCACHGQPSVEAARILRQLSAEEMRAVHDAIATKAALCVALAYDSMPTTSS